MTRISGIGSLPQSDATDAARFVAATTTVPYLPQLPNRHPEEGMLRQWGDGLCGCGATDAEAGLVYGAPTGPREEAFGGAVAILEAIRSDPPAGVKTQATGPLTLALAMRTAGHPGRGLAECVVAGLQDGIRRHVEWIRSQLPGCELLVLLDEPALGAVATVPGFPISRATAADMLTAVRAGIEAPVGIHCCAETDWAWLSGLGFAAVSWDLMTLGPAFGDAAAAVAGAVATGTELMWGVVPAAPFPQATEQSRWDTFRALTIELMVAGAPLPKIVTDAWYTPSCGLAGVSVDQAEWVMDEVSRFAERVASDHG